MSTLTVRTTEYEDTVIEKVKAKYHCTAATKALLVAASKCLTLEDEVAKLRQERQQLLSQVSNYREAGRSVIKGLSSLTELIKT